MSHVFDAPHSGFLGFGNDGCVCVFVCVCVSVCVCVWCGDAREDWRVCTFSLHTLPYSLHTACIQPACIDDCIQPACIDSLHASTACMHRQPACIDERACAGSPAQKEESPDTQTAGQRGRETRAHTHRVFENNVLRDLAYEATDTGAWYSGRR